VNELRYHIDRMGVDRAMVILGIALLLVAHTFDGLFSWALLVVGIAAVVIGGFAGGYRVAEAELDSSFLRAGGTES
jgi:hypothetical protein